MTQSHAAEGGDLVDLAARLRALDLETGLKLSLALRAAARERNRLRSLKGASTKRANFNAIDRFKGEMM